MDRYSHITLENLRVALEIARNKEPGRVADELDRIELESGPEVRALLPAKQKSGA